MPYFHLMPLTLCQKMPGHKTGVSRDQSPTPRNYLDAATLSWRVMEFNCTDRNYTIIINPSSWENSLSSFSYSYRSVLQGLQTLICLINLWRSLCLWLPVSRAERGDRSTAAPSENSIYLQDKVSGTCLFTGTCLTGCCSTTSSAQFNSLRLGSSYNSQVKGKGFLTALCCVRARGFDDTVGILVQGSKPVLEPRGQAPQLLVCAG